MEQELVNAARAVRDNAHAPYSGFKVGAALRCASGAVFTGCNVENVAYPQGLCAEAGAIAAMIAAGGREIAAIAIIADSARPVAPCGGCRQKLAEFATAQTHVIMTTLDGRTRTALLSDLLPHAFADRHMPC